MVKIIGYDLLFDRHVADFCHCHFHSHLIKNMVFLLSAQILSPSLHMSLRDFLLNTSLARPN